MIHYITSNGIGNAWVANELHEVQRAGIPFTLHAMRRPASHYHRSGWAKRIDAATRVLYPLPALGLIASILAAPWLFRRRFFEAAANALLGQREHFRARLAGLAHLGVACHWARSLRRQRVSLIHAQWVHSSGTIGMYGAWLLDVPFSFTGHATDLFRDRVALPDKVRRAAFIVCISTFHRTFYLNQGARPSQLHLAYCGIDTDLFRGELRPRRPDEPLHILAAGRLVEKKGFAHLIDACDRLARRNVEFRCTLAGSGPLENELRQRVRERGLEDRIALTGEAVQQEEIPAFMAAGDVFCLPCIRASDDDVDGLPQILMEAMACGLPAVSTRLVGIPDLVVHEETGLLVEPGDPEQLADALHRLRDDPGLAARLAVAGQRYVQERFDIRHSLEPLLSLFRQQLGEEDRPAAQATAGPTAHPSTRIETPGTGPG